MRTGIGLCSVHSYNSRFDSVLSDPRDVVRPRESKAEIYTTPPGSLLHKLVPTNSNFSMKEHHFQYAGGLHTREYVVLKGALSAVQQ